MEVEEVMDSEWSNEKFQKLLIIALLEIRDQISSLDYTTHQIGLKLKEGITTFPESV